jgi:hypothetical protein
MKLLRKKDNKNNKIDIGSLIYAADAANSNDIWKKAQDLYKQGKLFNIVLRGIGSVGDFEISKNRIYTNDSIAEAYSTYNNLISEFPYYRFMFDSHPSSESDENPDMGESNSYEDVAAYILKLRLSDLPVNGSTHKVISFDYVVTKQSTLDYFMRAIDPVFAFSHRGFMGNITKLPRTMVKEKNNNIRFMTDAFNSLEFWNSNSDTVDYVEFLRLLGFDFVTYPADFLCTSTKKDIIGYNVTEYNTQKSVNVANHNYIFQYMNDKCAQISSPYSILRMKLDRDYLRKKLKSEAIFDEVKIILQNNGEVQTMKINPDKLTDKDYMFGLFDDLNGMFKELTEIWSMDSQGIGEWLDSALTDEYKEKIENRDEFVDSIKVLFDNHDAFAELFGQWNDEKVLQHNTNIIKVMIDTIGVDNFKIILDKQFNNEDETIVGMLSEYKDSNEKLHESINTNLSVMASDADYYKGLAEQIITTLAGTTDDKPETTDEPVVDGDAVVDPTDKDPTDTIVVEEGLKISNEKSDSPWDGESAKSICTNVMKDELLGESDFKQMTDEMFAIARSYDAHKCWKLPHHDILVNGKSVSLTINEVGLRAAVGTLLGARQNMIATSTEKQQAAAHLMKHFDELEIEVPDSLRKVAESAKFAELVVEGDFVLVLDDDFAKKIADEQVLIKTDTVDTETEVLKVLDAIYTIMQPFVTEGACIQISEDIYKKLAQSLNGAAIGFASVLNGEGNDIMNIQDNAIVSTMREQINTLKDELTQTKDSALSLTKERDTLLLKVSDYETKVTAIGQLTDDVGKATQMVEDANSLANQKLSLIFTHRQVLDDDIFKEIMGAKSVDQLQTIGKWVSKMTSKKVVLGNSFNNDKIVPDRAETPTPDDLDPSISGGILSPPTDVKPGKSTTLDGDDTIKTILQLIRSTH